MWRLGALLAVVGSYMYIKLDPIKEIWQKWQYQYMDKS